MGMQNCTATLDNSLVVSYKVNHIQYKTQKSHLQVFAQEKWDCVTSETSTYGVEEQITGSEVMSGERVGYRDSMREFFGVM